MKGSGQKMKVKFYVGSYAPSEENSIYLYELDTGKGALRRIDAVKGVDNPSYLLVHPNGKILYAVEELTPDGRLAVFSKNNTLKHICSIESLGADPCHLSLDEKGEFLFVANYTSGSLSVYQLDENGNVIKCTDHKQHEGHGTDPERQEGPHAHFSGMVDQELLVCDLGMNCIVRYQLDRKTGKLEEKNERIYFHDGFGPRHFAVHESHPNHIYVIGELTGEVAVWKKIGADYQLIQVIDSLPEGYQGENTAAAIKFDEEGSLLFVSNRGSDSITSFRVTEEGDLEKLSVCVSGGKGPRDFEIFGKTLVVANQYTDNLAVLQVENATGEMKILSEEEKIFKPVMIQKYIK